LIADTGIEPQLIRRAYEQVADHLRALIISGALPPGARLPLESDLADEFGVSRPTVREALRSLSGERLVHTTKGPGGGTFVTLPTLGSISDFVTTSLTLLRDTQMVTLDEFLETRRLLETHAAGRAAERRSAEDVERLHATIPSAPLRLTTTEQFVHNRDFHLKLLEIAQNSLLYVAARPVFSVLETKLERSKLDKPVHKAINEQHLELAALVEAGDVEAAEAAMAAHLDYL